MGPNSSYHSEHFGQLHLLGTLHYLQDIPDVQKMSVLKILEVSLRISQIKATVLG